MNNVTAIVAVDANNGIGEGDNLLFKNVADMAWFVGFTMNKACLVGYNTFQTLPRLTGREIVLDEGYGVAKCLKTLQHDQRLSEVVVIGGAKTYKKYSDQVERLYITKFYDSIDSADVFFDVGDYGHLDNRVVLFKTEEFVVEEWS